MHVIAHGMPDEDLRPYVEAWEMSTTGFRYDALVPIVGSPLTDRGLSAILEDRGFRCDDLRITEHIRSGRNRLYLIDGLEGKSWMAKQNLVFSGSEAWFYSNAAIHVGAAPACLFAEPLADLVVMEHLADTRTLYQEAWADASSTYLAFENLAPALVRLHSMATSVPDIPSVHLPFPRLDPIDIRFWVTSSPAACTLITYVQERARLNEAFHHALDGAGPQGLVHGDLKLDNVLTSSDGCVIIDWECCGWGSLGWDLGALVGSMITLWVDLFSLRARGPINGSINGNALPLDDLQRVVRRFLGHYLEHAGRCGLFAPDRECVAVHSAAWIVGRTWAEATQMHQLAPFHLMRLVVAEALVDNPRDILGDTVW